MRKKILITLIIVGLFVAGAWSVLMVNQRSQTQKENYAKNLADSHIIRFVGEEFFRQNFEQLPTSYQTLEDKRYRINYEFLPLKRLGVQSIMTVFYSEEKLETSKMVHQIPHCIEDPSVCEFNITQEELVATTRQHGGSVYSLILKPPLLTAEICENELRGKRLSINYRTKETNVEYDASINCVPLRIIEEERGVLKIKSTPEYKALMKKYGAEKVHVKAVENEHLNSITFLKTIDTRFADMSGCIIVVEAPNGEGFVYQQDEELNTIHRITLAQFKEGLKKIDPKTVENFYSKLK